MENTRVVFCDSIDHGRERLLEGAKTVNRAVGATMGPKGKLVLISKDGKPVATKDGVTVSKSVKIPSDPVADLGAKLIQEAAWQTNEKSGDGTTTSTVLSYEMMNRSHKMLTAGFSSKELVVGMESALAKCINLLDAQTEKADTDEKIRQVAYISSNNDAEIAEIVSHAVKKTLHGIVTVEESKHMKSQFVSFPGIYFDRGYTSPYFVNDAKKGRVYYENAKLLLVDGSINSFGDIIKVLEGCIKESAPILIMADDFEGDALQGLVTNRNKAGLKIAAVRTPGQSNDKRDLLNDIAVVSCAEIIRPDALKNMKDISQLGSIFSFEVNKSRTTIIAHKDRQDAIREHADNLRKLRTTAIMGLSAKEEDAHKLLDRIAKLSGAVGVIYAGGATETEMIERKHRIEDAVNATVSAVSDGIVPGGGVALLDIVRELQRNTLTDGEKIVVDSLSAPFTTILSNAGIETPVILSQIIDSSDRCVGYDVFSGKISNMREAGVIDPVRVTKSALVHAVSVASTFVSLDAIITEDDTRHVGRILF